MSRRLGGSVAVLSLVAVGCRFDADYSGTRFACGAIEPRCPALQSCIDGVCVAVSPMYDARVSGHAADAPAEDVADAAVVDASPAAADASRPDAFVADAMITIPPGLEASADTTLDSKVPTHNHGVALDLAIHNDAPRSTAVVRFDLSAIAPGTILASAILHVRVAPGGEDAAVVELHRVLETWQEGTKVDATGAASWNDRRVGVAWSGEGAQGGSSGFAAMGTIAASGAGTYDVPLDLATVQSWVTSPSNNNGMVLIPVSGSALRLVSREGAVAGRPRLELVLR